MAFYALRAQKKYLMLVSVKFVTSSGAVAVRSTYHNAAGQPLKQKKKNTLNMLWLSSQIPEQSKDSLEALCRFSALLIKNDFFNVENLPWL